MISPSLKLTKSFRIAQHIINTIIVLISIDLVLLEGNFLDNLLPALKYIPICLAAFCVTNLWLTPRFFFTKKYLPFFTLLILLVLTAGIITSLMHYAIDLNGFNNTNSINISNIFFKSIFLFSLFLSRNFTTNLAVINSENSIKQNILQKGRAEEELQFLMFQIQPHFFLNTINNLYALAIENSKKMPEALVHLADMLRHIVYNAQGNKTLLFKEVEAVECYTKILQLGFEKPLNISVTISDDQSILIPNSALLTLFEGAVKHSKIGRVPNSFITVKSITSNERIVIEVSNNIALKDDEKEFGGCGLDNLQKQLDLLYHNEQILTTKVQSNIFVAILNIPLQYENLHHC